MASDHAAPDEAPTETWSFGQDRPPVSARVRLAAVAALSRSLAVRPSRPVWARANKSVSNPLARDARLRGHAFA